MCKYHKSNLDLDIRLLISLIELSLSNGSLRRFSDGRNGSIAQNSRRPHIETSPDVFSYGFTVKVIFKG